MIAIVNYGSGNTGSILNILTKIGAKAIITSDEATIREADKIILPGVGAFDSCAARLRDSGLVPVLQQRAIQDKVPLLGICVGMQLLFEKSEEGIESGLGWIPGTVVKFKTESFTEKLPIPHMGWTDVSAKAGCDLVADMHDHPRFYFVHSYHVVPTDSADILMTARYGYDFTAAVQRNNISGVQFHPEKSHRFGMQLLKNFVARR